MPNIPTFLMAKSGCNKIDMLIRHNDAKGALSKGLMSCLTMGGLAFSLFSSFTFPFQLLC